MATPEKLAEIAALQKEIKEIDQTLAAGVSSFSIEGVTTSIDLAFLQRHRATLAERLALLENPPEQTKPRKLFNTFDTSRFTQ